MNAYDNLLRLSIAIVNGHYGNSKAWQGADVVIVSQVPVVEEGGFYPAPRYVITSHATELSWLFEQVREIFMEIDDYGFLKEEIFGG